MKHETIAVASLAGGLALAACLAADWSFASPPAPTNAKNDDSAATRREQFLEGDEWEETMRSWDAWLDTQKLYDSGQVKRMKQALKEQVERSSLEELDKLQDELHEKLAILEGPEAASAGRWLSETLAVASEKYAKQVRTRMPDVVNLSPDELQAAFDKFTERLAQTVQGEAEILQARRDRLKVVQADLRQQHDDIERAMNSAGRNANAGGGRRVAPSTLHNRQSFSQRNPRGWGIGFW
ncbi:MAG TPA: hypothetical protein VGX76_23210 [Pirellulales bacterium]|nr:hypothetical protein [Pirellulales bacterium]